MKVVIKNCDFINVDLETMSKLLKINLTDLIVIGKKNEQLEAQTEQCAEANHD